MWHDIKTGFRDCSLIMKLQLVIPVIVLLAVLVRIAMKHQAYAFDISIIYRKNKKQFHIRICYLEFIQRHEVCLLVCIMIVTLLVGGGAIIQNRNAIF